MSFASDSSNRVACELTPIGTLELAAVLRDGHYAVFGFFPSKQRLAVGWAQVAIENRQGKETYNHNLGNINSAKSRPYYVKHHRFKAHPDFQTGAQDYWKIVRKLCSASLPAFNAGAPYAAAQQLSRCGYYGANPDLYGKAMLQLYAKAMSKVIPKL
jgi:hypothetical protein